MRTHTTSGAEGAKEVLIMRKLGVVLVLGLIAGIASAEDYPILSAGGGGMNPLDYDRTIIWEDTPNLDGLIGSSEQILEFGLESELANDFLIEAEVTICKWTWWGGYYGYVPGDPLVDYWNMRVYDDGGCVPLNVLLEIVTPSNANETFIYDQGGFPIYEYWHCEAFPLQPNLYWFGAQAGDHVFPPQWGRLAAEIVQLCDTVFKSAYFAFPDWIPAIDVFGQPYDASQRMEDDCATPVEMTTWGAIRSLY
jgi:hypothetical protein